MRLKFYLDTSVIGAICDPGPEDRLIATWRLLNGVKTSLWEGYISTLVLEEIDRAPVSVKDQIVDALTDLPLTVLEETPESLELAQKYVAAGVVPRTYEDDARHIAVATVNDIRIIVSWNFRHIVNIRSKQRVNSVNLQEGFPLIDLISPWEVYNEQTDE